MFEHFCTILYQIHVNVVFLTENNTNVVSAHKDV